MDEMFVADIGGYQENGEWVMEYKTRTWPYILLSLNWIFSQKIPGSTNVQNGLGLIVINEIASVVEAILLEIVVQNLKGTKTENNSKIQNLNRLGISYKTTEFNRIMERQLSSYPYYETIENLFLLRNHISHGRPHIELSSNKEENLQDPVKSSDKNYENVRQFLIAKDVIKAKNTISNVSDLWNINCARFFFNQSINFVTGLVFQTEFKGKDTLLLNWKMALQNQY